MDAIKDACAWCDRMRPLATVIITACAFALFAYGAYTVRSWIQDDSPVVEFIGGEISAKTARPDDLMIVYLNVRKLKDCPGVVQRRLTGDCGEHWLSETATYLPEGFVGRVTLPFQVPAFAIPGDCGFVVHSWFFCNPVDFIRDRHYQSPPIPFRVLRYDE
jgi:hypothetical protein